MSLRSTTEGAPDAAAGPPAPGSAAPLYFFLAALGHAIAWILYWALGHAPESPAIPAWGALVLWYAGREGILAVFSLAAALPLHAAAAELTREGRRRWALASRLLTAALSLALAWRWFAAGHLVSAALAALLALPALLGP